MLKIFNVCLDAINKCIKNLLEDGLLCISNDFGDQIKPYQRNAVDNLAEGCDITEITGCHLPSVDIHGMPTDSMVVGVQYTKDNRLHWTSALVVSNPATEWTNVSVLESLTAAIGVDEDDIKIVQGYPSIATAGEMSLNALTTKSL